MSALRVAIRQGLTRKGCVGLTEVDGQVELESAYSCYLYNFHNVTKYFLDDGELCNAFDLTQAEDIKKRWQEYTEELQAKRLNDPDNQNGVITHLELILEHILEHSPVLILEHSQVGLRKHHYKVS